MDRNETAQDERANADLPGGQTDLRLRDFFYAAAIIAATTLVGIFVIAPLWPGKLALLFLASVLIVGHRLGMWPALAAALMAFCAYDVIFEEPRFTFSFNGEDMFALITFLVGASLVGGLTGRLSDHARRLKRALADMTSLFEASRDLSVTVDPKSASERVVRHLQAHGCRAEIRLAGDATPLDAGATLMPLSADRREVGVVALWPGRKGEMPDPRWTRAVLDLTAVAIDRARLIVEIAEARVIAEKEGLRTALLSSLSHDLRTPLSTILASATSLLEYEDKFDAATRRDLLLAIQDESERMNRYVANLLEMTRLESGALQVGRCLIDPREAMSAALRRMQRRLIERRVVRDFAADCGHIDVDPVLLEQALANLVENAVVHTQADSRIVARVEMQGACVVLAVEDEGGGIAAADLPHVFDKFFRGGGDRRRGSGVGLGLAVTRGLVEAFNGSVAAISPLAHGHGTQVRIELPAHTVMETNE